MSMDPVVLDFYGDVAGFVNDLKLAERATSAMKAGFDYLSNTANSVSMDGVSATLNKAGIDTKKLESAVQHLGPVLEYAKASARNFVFNFAIMSAADLASELVSLTNITDKMAASFGIDTNLFDFAAATQSAADFGQTMTQLQSVADASTGELEMLRDEAIRLGESTKFSSGEAAAAQLMLARSGQDVDAVMASLEPTLRLAIAGEVGIAEAADIATGILAGMGMQANELSGIVDGLAKASNISKADVRDMGQAFQMVGSFASSAGVSFEDTAASLAILADANLKAGSGGTALRNVLSDLTGGSSTAVDFFEQIGLVTQTATGQLRPMGDIIDDLNLRLAGMGEADRAAKLMAAFGERAGPALQVMLQRGGDAWREYATAMENSGGAAQKLADANMGGLAGALSRTQGAVDTFRQNLGEMLLPIITQVAEGVAWMAEQYGSIVNAIKPVVAWIATSIKSIGDYVASISQASEGTLTFGQYLFMAAAGMQVFFAVVANYIYLRGMWNLLKLIIPLLWGWYTGTKNVTVATAILQAISGNWKMLVAGLLAAGLAVAGINHAFKQAAEDAKNSQQPIRDVAEEVNRFHRATAKGAELKVSTAKVSKDIQDTIRDIEAFNKQHAEALLTFGMTGPEAEAKKLMLRGADWGDVMPGLLDAQELAKLEVGAELNKDIADLTKQLQVQAATLGMTAAAAEIYRLAMRGASNDQLAAARAAADHIKNLNDEKKWMDGLTKDAESLKQSLLTPLQQYEAEAQRIKAMAKNGLINEEEYLKAMDKLNDKYEIGEEAARKRSMPQIFSGMEELSRKIQESVFKGQDDKEKKRIELQEQANAYARRQLEELAELKKAGLIFAA